MVKVPHSQNNDTKNTGQTKPRFIHLRVHSAYSLLEGALKVKQMVEHAINDAMPALAITDTNNLFGALEFSQTCLKEGIQPIIGCQLAIDFQDGTDDVRSQRARFAVDFPSLVLLSASQQGYEHLVHLVSRAYLEKADLDAPHIKASWLQEAAEGIIALSGGPLNGPIDKTFKEDKPSRAMARFNLLKDTFRDRLYIELHRHGAYDQVHEAKMLELAYRQSVPIVATNEAFFATPKAYEAHDALLAVAEGQIVSNPERRRVTPDHYLKSQEEMALLFADLPEALDNSVEVALRCHTYAQTRSPILPRFTGQSSEDIARGAQGVGKTVDALVLEAEELRKQAKEGLKKRLETIGPAASYTLKDYEERLEYELSVIVKMQFPGYFLIVADFIKWAKEQGIPVGPGRGSGAGSLVAYALTITDIDPLRFSLLFERFLNPDRVSMPDFDIDFCQDRREEVIQYVQHKYGRSQVAQIITFGKLQARIVLRDVGRVLEMPYRQVDYLTKLVPVKLGSNTELATAIKDEPKFLEEQKKEPLIGRLLDIALQLEGLYRHASTHAAGIVIGDRPLWQLVPMYRDPRSDMPVTQFNMKYVEQAGLVKFDFLGLKTLTVLKTAVDFVAQKGISIDLSQIPLDDKATYALLAKGETVGVFQVESAGMRKALLGMKPDCIEDIIALVALYRPGPMDNIPIYNARKNGQEEIASIHPQIDHLLQETQGVIVYQEQVMQIAQVLAGYSLGEADLLRRAMGKKIASEMEQQRSRFVDGAVERHIDARQANAIFDLLAKFADYGFNKSHAAAYAIVSYQTAYMKAHFPVAFLAATMTYDMANTEKLNDFRRDALRLEIAVIPPSVQTSCRAFAVGENCIYYSLAAIKGVGEPAVDHIVECRGDKPFQDLADFCERIDPRIVNRRVLESLIQAGALDCFGTSREILMAGVDAMHARAARVLEDNRSGQVDMFGMAGSAKEALLLPKAKPWAPAEKLHREFQVLGFYLSAHPLDEYQKVLENTRVQTWETFARMVQKGAEAGRLAGTVATKQIRKTRSGKKMAIVQFSDPTGQYEAVLFSEGLEAFGDQLEPGRSVVVSVAAENRPEGVGLRVQTVSSLESAAERFHKTIHIFIRNSDVLDTLAQTITANANKEGDGEISIILIQDNGAREVEVLLPGRYRVNPQLAGALKAVFGVVDVALI